MLITISNLLPEHHDLAVAIELSSNPHPWSDYSLRNALAINESYGLFLGKDLVCFMLYSQVLQQIDIVHIVCNKESQNKGYSKKLLAEFIIKIKSANISQIFLEVRQSNLAAISLYKRLGFLQIGIRKNYYAIVLNDGMKPHCDLVGNLVSDCTREDALSMCLNIE